ncbi:MAG: hypothetical protein NTY04_02435 [Candidatus Staskawiczbacteria bacterium]|nr:hypothetical protein [Candidatus Staskawiczbacteria bacterium]
MTTATLSFYRVQKNLQSKINSIDVPIVNWKAVCSVGFFVSLALLVFYVWQINDLTQGSYVISGYDRQITQLTEEKKNLEISFAENSFMGQALTKIQALNFQKAISVKYINILDNSAKVTQKNKDI